MPRKPGPGRYFLAVFLLTLEAPVVLVLAVGAVLSRALLAVSRAVQVLARSSAALAADGERERHGPQPTRAVNRPGPRR
jgi:hypothetical protein